MLTLKEKNLNLYFINTKLKFTQHETIDFQKQNKN